MAGGHNVDPGQPGGGAAGVPAQWFGDDPAVTSASSRAPGVISTSSPALRLGELLLAAERAVDIGAAILRQGRSHIGALIAKGDRDFATTVDVQVESAVRTSLSLSAPAIPFLGEEQGGESGVEQLWVLDPIDGTINFARDSPLCAISLSLVIDGQPVLGIVDAPLIGERFVAQHGAGVYLNGDRIEACEVSGLDEAIVGVADFKVGVGAEDENRVHLAVVGRLARESLRVRMQGSAALDLAWLAAGRLNATMMLSNLPWDVTAGLLLVREAGGLVYDYDGSDHGPTSRYTLASVPSLARPMRQLVEEAM
jgi:myo-inositol-1(or 4)-monophosphatase